MADRRGGIAVVGLALAAALGIAAGHAAAPDDPDRELDRAAAEAAVVGIEPEGLTCFIGGVRKGAFARSDELAASLRDGQSYRLYDLDGAREEVIAIGTPRNEGSEGECSELWRQELSLPRNRNGGFAVALHATHGSPPPRKLEVLAEPTEEHRQLLATFLARRGIAEPDPHFEQIIRTDIDGDGTEETILNVVRVGEDHARAGDHSVLLVVRGTGSALHSYVVQDEVTVEDNAYSSTLWVNRIVAVLDIDGDGTAEIVTNGGYIYGGGWEVIRFDGAGFEFVLFCGCDG